MNKLNLSKESETLMFPLYSKALLSKKGILVYDKKAEEIVNQVNYDFSRVKISRLNDLYMGVRAAILDSFTEEFLNSHPDAVVLHLGCGLDSRINRINARFHHWYDLDLPEVIKIRKLFYEENISYHMISSSVADLKWLDNIEAENRPLLVIAEGLTMYLHESDIQSLFLAFCKRFKSAAIAFDAYSVKSVEISQKRNPVNKMGAVIRWGLDDPKIIEAYNEKIHHLKTMLFTDCELINTLRGLDKFYFSLIKLFKRFNNLYRIFFFEIYD